MWTWCVRRSRSLPVRRFSERGGPRVERQVQGDNGGTALIALTDQLEQQLGAGFAEWHEAEFIDDQQLMVHQMSLKPQEAPVVAQ